MEQKLLIGILLSGALFVSACGGASNAPPSGTGTTPSTSPSTSSGATTAKTVSVSVSPTTASIGAGASLAFTATVSGSDNGSVTWSVQEGNLGGTVTSGGVYTAPSAPGTYHVIATSQADSTQNGVATITVTAPSNTSPSSTIPGSSTAPPSTSTGASFTIVPAKVSLATGQSQSFTAAFPINVNNAVTWKVQEGAGGGMITPEGVYTAPNTKGAYHITATSQTDPGQSQTAEALVLPGGITRISISSSDRADPSLRGVQGDNDTSHPKCTSWFSADGRYIAFASHANNLIDGDTNYPYNEDAFLNDRLTGVTIRLSVGTGGIQADNGNSNSPFMSDDRRYVVFTTYANNLDPRDTNHYRDMYVHDLQANVTTYISHGYDGSAGNDVSGGSPQMSGDGRYVVFNSSASNLVPGDLPIGPLPPPDGGGHEDTFVHDMQNDVTVRVSVDPSGAAGNGASAGSPAISNSGRFIAFYSDASNLVSNDTNGVRDVFVYELETDATGKIIGGRTTCVTCIGYDGHPSNNGSGGGFDATNPNAGPYGLPSIPKDVPFITPDGRYVAFFSDASNLVPGDTNGVRDMFVHDTVTHTTTRVSVDSNGNEASCSPSNPYRNICTDGNPWLTPDGRYVVFESYAGNLDPKDANVYADIFVHDMATGKTACVTCVGYNGLPSNGDSLAATISADGHWITFASDASNLVPNDTNADPANNVIGRDVFVAPLPFP